MKRDRLVERLARAGTVLALVLAPHASAFAQGCVMCKTSMAGSADAAEIAFKINLGVLTLLIPVAALFIGIFLIVYRYRDSFGTMEIECDERLISALTREYMEIKE